MCMTSLAVYRNVRDPENWDNGSNRITKDGLFIEVRGCNCRPEVSVHDTDRPAPNDYPVFREAQKIVKFRLVKPPKD